MATDAARILQHLELGNVTRPDGKALSVLAESMRVKHNIKIEAVQSALEWCKSRGLVEVTPGPSGATFIGTTAKYHRQRAGASRSFSAGR